MIEKEEEFRALDGFPNYSISDQGRILNVLKNKIIARSFNGYELTVGLMRDGKQHRRSVRRLVAITFVEGRNKIFDTPMLLDGDRNNLRADNIVWRPLWFSREQIQQFQQEEDWWYKGPIIDITTGIVYNNVYEAGVAIGSLFRDIYISIMNGGYVFPGRNIFDFY